MSETKDTSTLSQYILTAACLVVLIAGLQAARAILAPLLLACFFAVILTPVMR